MPAFWEKTGEEPSENIGFGYRPIFDYNLRNRSLSQWRLSS